MAASQALSSAGVILDAGEVSFPAPPPPAQGFQSSTARGLNYCCKFSIQQICRFPHPIIGILFPKPIKIMSTNNIIAFQQPEPHKPQNLEEFILVAQNAANSAFCICMEQIEAVKLADQSERRGDRQRGEDLRAAADRKSGDIAEGFLNALVQLRRLQDAAIQWLEFSSRQLKKLNVSLCHAVSRVAEWDTEKPAVELLEPCWALVRGINPVSIPFLKPIGLEAITPSTLGELEARVRAQSHAGSMLFLERAANLMRVPWVTRPA